MVVDSAAEVVRVQELEQTFNVSVVIGDITHEFLLHELRLQQARRVVLLGDDDFKAYEAASKILRLYPHLAGGIVLHCQNLRFLRAMQDTYVAQHITGFNSYHLAATGLVRDQLIAHFKKTSARDIVVIAGFGRFGQTILEELHQHAENEIDMVLVIDVDARRRMAVAEEQQRLGSFYRREVLQGDVSHPEVWRSVADIVDLSTSEPAVILGTGRSDDNLRTGLWIKRNSPSALVFARTDDYSEFAERLAADHDINSISITQLVEDNIPRDWVS
jgi:Trk K+ transport system NAD-binding subunit